MAPIAALLADLLYDDERRRLALAWLAAEQSRLAEHWRRPPGPRLVADLGHALLGEPALVGAA